MEVVENIAETLYASFFEFMKEQRARKVWFNGVFGVGFFEPTTIGQYIYLYNNTYKKDIYNVALMWYNEKQQESGYNTAEEDI